MSEDVLFTLKCLKKLGIKINLNKNTVKLLEMELIALIIKKT